MSHTRGWLLCCAGVIGAGVLADKAIGRLPTLMLVLHGQPVPPPSPEAPAASVIHEGVWIALALLAFGCVVLADGPRRAGLGGSPARNAWVFATYLGPVQFVISIVAIAVALTIRLAGLDRYVGHDGLDFVNAPLWYVAYSSTQAGIVEEVLLCGVAFRLLEAIPRRRDGRAFVDSGAATALLIGLRLSYHTYHGLMMIAIAVLTWMTIRLYRHHRTLLPLVVGHILYDLCGASLILRVAVMTAGFLLYLSLLPARPPGPRIHQILQPLGLPSRVHDLHHPDRCCAPTLRRWWRDPATLATLDTPPNTPTADQLDRRPG